MDSQWRGGVRLGRLPFGRVGVRHRRIIARLERARSRCQDRQPRAAGVGASAESLDAGEHARMLCWPTRPSVATAVVAEVVGDEHHAAGRRVNPQVRVLHVVPALRVTRRPAAWLRAAIDGSSLPSVNEPASITPQRRPATDPTTCWDEATGVGHRGSTVAAENRDGDRGTGIGRRGDGRNRAPGDRRVRGPGRGQSRSAGDHDDQGDPGGRIQEEDAARDCDQPRSPDHTEITTAITVHTNRRSDTKKPRQSASWGI